VEANQSEEGNLSIERAAMDVEMVVEEPTASDNGAMHSPQPQEVEAELVVSAPVDLKKRRLEGDGDIAQANMVCLICDSPDVKYRCPRCERITCSLACCVAHKKQVGTRELGLACSRWHLVS
jgi:hypothetical protein